MDKTPTAVARPMNKVLSNVDAMFFLAIALIIAGVGVAISLR